MKKSGVALALAFLLALSLALGGEDMLIDNETRERVRDYLLGRHGEELRLRIERGVAQAASFWRAEDGSAEDFVKFCKSSFIADPGQLHALFQRLETNLESLHGHLNRIHVDLKRPLHVDQGAILDIDESFGRIDPAAHVSDDLFDAQIAFSVLLNFPSYTLAQKEELGVNWSRQEWAYARGGDLFLSRLPAAVNQRVAAALSAAETYIAQYRIAMDRLVDDQGASPFPAGLKLISHWGLRDHIRALYAEPDGLARQEMISEVLKRIIQQDIPRRMVNRDEFTWNPLRNKVFKDGREVSWTPEPNSRYMHLRHVFQALCEMDEHFPGLPSHPRRKFELERELGQEAVEKLLESVLNSDEARGVAELIAGRLGRELQPFDIWYSCFKPRARIAEAELDRRVRLKYPSLERFARGLRLLLQRLGFAPSGAAFIAERVEVEPARGAGHAWGAQMRSEKSLLRTRSDGGALNYQGFNVAMHELGHCAEQVLSLQRADSWLMAGVPNTAITEAFAFLFQNRDLEMLGLPAEAGEARHMRALDTLWMTYEIAGVALVDMKVWDWLYANPEASPDALRRAVMACARDVWNRYYAPVFGVRDQVILAAYSHMIDAPLYLADYPLGHIIAFQLEGFLRGKSLGLEMERMCRAGRLTPQLWMKNAVGAEISTEPLLAAAREALSAIKK